MDGSRFDALTRVLTAASRRSLLGAVGTTALSALLGLGPIHEAHAKCKKKCGPCRRCKKGKCKKKKPDGTPCGPCSRCEGGRCQALCSSEHCRNDVCQTQPSCSPPCTGCSVCEKGSCRELCPSDECVDDDGEAFCLLDCTPACNLCQTCNRLTGECESNCESQFCTEDGCRVPCGPPCGECAVCDFGECVEQCTSEECDAGVCQIPCSPDCGTNRACFAGECFPVCNPPCDANEGCVAGNQCIPLAGDCPGNADFCTTGVNVTCQTGSGGGRCIKLNDGTSFCDSSITCTPCATDLDCQNWGFGPNSRCVAECDFCNPNGGTACATFAGG
jgi:hypothetical protein